MKGCELVGQVYTVEYVKKQVSTPLAFLQIFNYISSGDNTEEMLEFTRASQVATRIISHSSMMTSWSWLMLERPYAPPPSI